MSTSPVNPFTGVVPEPDSSRPRRGSDPIETLLKRMREMPSSYTEEDALEVRSSSDPHDGFSSYDPASGRMPISEKASVVSQDVDASVQLWVGIDRDLSAEITQSEDQKVFAASAPVTTTSKADSAAQTAIAAQPKQSQPIPIKRPVVKQIQPWSW